MAETLASGRKGGRGDRQGSIATVDTVSAWFVREILPLEAALTRYLRRNRRNAGDIADLRQEVYTRVFDAARDRIPDDARRFLVVTARNLLINVVRHEQIVPIESISDHDLLDVPSDAAGPDRVTAARNEIRRLQNALDRLPSRTKEAIILAYVEELKIREIAARLGVAKSTASTHLTSGLRALADMLYGDSDETDKKP